MSERCTKTALECGGGAAAPHKRQDLTYTSGRPTAELAPTGNGLQGLAHLISASSNRYHGVLNSAAPYSQIRGKNNNTMAYVHLEYDESNWPIAVVALSLLFGIPALICAIISPTKIHRSNDATRGWTIWHNIGFITFSIDLIFNAVSNLLFALILLGTNMNSKGQQQTTIFATLFDNLTQIAILLALFSLRNSIALRDSRTPRPVDKVFSIVGVALAVVLFILTVFQFAVSQVYYTAVQRRLRGYSYGFSEGIFNLVRAATKVYFAQYVLLMAAAVSLSVAGVAAIVTAKRGKGAPVVLTVCAVLFLLVTTYLVGYDIAYVPLTDSAYYSYRKVAPKSFLVVDFMLLKVPMFCIFCTLFGYGMRTRAPKEHAIPVFYPQHLYSQSQPMAQRGYFDGPPPQIQQPLPELHGVAR